MRERSPFLHPVLALYDVSMLKTIITLCAAALAFGADDPWAKVKELKTGAELQVYKRGSVQPLSVKMDELTDQNLIVINKNAQTGAALAFISDPWGTMIELNDRHEPIQ